MPKRNTVIGGMTKGERARMFASLPIERRFRRRDDLWIFLDVLAQAWGDGDPIAAKGYDLAIEEIVRCPSRWNARKVV